MKFLHIPSVYNIYMHKNFYTYRLFETTRAPTRLGIKRRAAVTYVACCQVTHITGRDGGREYGGGAAFQSHLQTEHYCGTELR
ncbi:hypothetical protein Y032_0008g338 [Ancylostoma ceylanicum]|uniref:Uncharacterized protein n=1 Tax=Ancylostoma ceylanicum TaxID=53326 RepID=A0A016VM71_9BILA|nr:hypothetical protein Y032_0008g338 [Ancylostoma ceylanicum]